MTTFYVCSGTGCENTAGIGDEIYHWAKVDIEISGQDYHAHYCPKCWFETFVNKVAPLTVEKKKRKKSGPKAD